MKRVSFKSFEEEISEIEPLQLSPNEIEKINIFNNNSEIVVKHIIEKIIANVFITIKTKDIDSLINTRCSNYILQEINSLISNYYFCYEKEDYFLKNTIFADNYLRKELPWDEYNLPQPKPGEMDRYKIHRAQIVNYKYRNRSQITEMEEGQSINCDIKNSKTLKKPKLEKISKLQKKIKEDREKEEEEETNKNRKLGVRDMDSFPSYPLSDDLFKIEINLTKEQKKQIEQYRAELLIKEELKKKENEKKEIIKKMKINEQMRNEDNITEGKKNINKYKGKTIGVTTNGEIIFIQNININNLKSEFLEINSRMKNNRNLSKLNKSNSSQNVLSSRTNDKKIEIEKNIVDESYLDFYKIANKEKMSQQIITGGSSFKNFIPEIGVNLKQNGNIKSGGTDFLNKYKKISLEQFEKTLVLFKKSNLANNEIIEIKNDNNTINNSNSNVLNSPSLLNNNSNNNINYNQKSLIKSSSLPELNQLNSKTNLESSNIFKSINNINMNMNMNNDSNIKNSFYYTNYNNSNIMNSTKYNNLNNFIKTSSSFRKMLFEGDNYYKEDENVIPNYTTKQFFKNFNPKIKNISSLQKKDTNSLNNIQDFNMNILKNNNWGSVSNNYTRNIFKPKPIINTTKKNYFSNSINNNNFRVRSNVNENYFRKIKLFNKIALRSQSTENKGEIKKILFENK